jgi:hypothetical protein
LRAGWSDGEDDFTEGELEEQRENAILAQVRHGVFSYAKPGCTPFASPEGNRLGRFSDDVIDWVLSDPDPGNQLVKDDGERRTGYDGMRMSIESFSHALDSHFGRTFSTTSYAPGDILAINFPPAAPRLFALLSALRRENAALLASLRSELERGAAAGNPFCGHLADIIAQGRAFTEVAVQSLWGGEEVRCVSDKKVNSHRDGPTSLLHAGISIMGSRTLFFQQGSDWRSVSQRRGDLYLSSPTCYQHTVAYHKSEGFHDRIVAIQARILLHRVDRDNLKPQNGTPGKNTYNPGEKHTAGLWMNMCKIVAIEVIKFGVRLPTLDQCKQRLRELQSQNWK